MKQLSFFDDYDSAWEFGPRPHSFTNRTCDKCGVSAADVANDSASWVCAAKIQSCCDKVGITRWDHEHSQWVCSNCNAVQSNDPNYTGGGKADLWSHRPSQWTTKELSNDPFKPKVVHPKQCDCTIQTLMNKGCQCGGK